LNRPSYYLSYVTTEFNQSDEEIMNIYSLDIKNDEYTNIAELPYYASYPTAIYDKTNNCIYYSNNQLSKENNDCVLKYDCQSKKSEMFLDNFVRINDILLSNDKTLCIIGNTKDNDIIQPYLYDIKLKKLTKVDIGKDMCFGDNYNCYTNEFLFTGFDDAYSRKMMEKYNIDTDKKKTINQKDYNIKNRIYKYKNNIELLSTISTGNIPLITNDSHKIIYGKYDGFSMKNCIFE